MPTTTAKADPITPAEAGRRLRAARRAAGLTQAELARRLGLPQPALSAIERGDPALGWAARALAGLLSAGLDPRHLWPELVGEPAAPAPRVPDRLPPPAAFPAWLSATAAAAVAGRSTQALRALARSGRLAVRDPDERPRRYRLDQLAALLREPPRGPGRPEKEPAGPGPGG